MFSINAVLRAPQELKNAVSDVRDTLTHLVGQHFKQVIEGGANLNPVLHFQRLPKMRGGHCHFYLDNDEGSIYISRGMTEQALTGLANISRVVDLYGKQKQTFLAVLKFLSCVDPNPITEQSKYVQNVVDMLGTIPDSDSVWDRNIKAHKLVWGDKNSFGHNLYSYFVFRKSSAITALMELIAKGYDWDAVASFMRSMGHPLNYRRPKAEVSEFQIANTEKFCQEHGYAAAFPRKMARVQDLPFQYWTKTIEPEEEPTSSDSLFDKIKPKEEKKSSVSHTFDQAKLRISGVSLTHFLNCVVDKAKSIKLRVHHGAEATIAIFTAPVNPESVPIFKHDREDERFAWSHVCPDRSIPLNEIGVYDFEIDIAGITVAPYVRPRLQEDSLLGLLDQALIFVMSGASFPEKAKIGLGLFPQLLIDDLQPHRSVIEQLSNSNMLEHVDTPAIGLCVRISATSVSMPNLIVTDVNDQVQEYAISTFM